ncbi:MAG: WD40 repeat domain-containing protein [Spirochaetia bacterium]
MKRIFIFVVLLATSFSLAWTENRVLISTGHTKSINDFALLESNNTLFSAGDDGTLRVWDPESNQLLHKLQISHLPIVKIAVHPNKPEVALVETDRINTYHLSVWNYSTGKELFSHKIQETPIFLKYSPQGTYLVYSRTDWKSLTFLDADSGRLEPLLGQGFGIVSDVFFSQSEKTLVTYNSSGTIRYWNTENGEQKTDPISTIGDLTQIAFSENGVFMLGVKGNTLYLVNLVNGQIEAREQFQNLHSYSFNSESNMVTLYITENSRPRFFSYRVERNNSLLPVQKSNMAPDDTQDPLQLIGSTLFFCKPDGSISTQSVFSSEEELFSKSVLMKVSDIGFSDNRLFIATENEIFSLRSSAFSTPKKAEGRNSDFSFSTERYKNPLQTESGITVFADKSFLLYPTQGEENSLYLFDTNRFAPLDSELTAPVQAAGLYDNSVLLLEQGGTLRIIDPIADEELFNYSSFGLQEGTESYNDKIIVARNKNEFINTTLLSINPQTSETVPIPDRNLLTFSLDYDHTTRSLYTLGFEKRRNSIRTVLKQHQGTNYGRVSTLLSYPGEDNDASVVVDPATSRVFTSLGYGNVHMFTWDGFTTLEKVAHIPRKLYVHAGLLYSLNGDSSIAVWDITHGKLLMTLYLFENSSWAITFSDGSYYASEGADQWIHQIRQ